MVSLPEGTLGSVSGVSVDVGGSVSTGTAVSSGPVSLGRVPAEPVSTVSVAKAAVSVTVSPAVRWIHDRVVGRVIEPVEPPSHSGNT